LGFIVIRGRKEGKGGWSRGRKEEEREEGARDEG
jgi:hypothetical protein